MIARVAALAAVVLAAVVVFVLLTSGSAKRTYSLEFQTAGQLVKDDDVQVGGRRIGSIKAIELTKDNRARIKVEVQEPYAPLHEGTTAVIRATSLSGVANRYIALTPGAQSSPELADNATLTPDKTTTIVDLDQLIDTFDEPTRKDLQKTIQGLSTQLKDKGDAAGQAAKYFNPALSTSRRLVQQLTADEGTLTAFLVNGSKTVTALAARRDDLSSTVDNTERTASAIAAEAQGLDAALAVLPTTLRRANTTFVNLRSTLDDLGTLVDVSKPATKDLAPFLRQLRPLVRDARPTVADLRRLVSRPGGDNDLVDATLKLPGLERAARPALRNSVTALKKTQPVLEFYRPYAPELVGWFRDFGQGAATYDANGHYARIQPISQRLLLHRERGRRPPLVDPRVGAPGSARHRQPGALPRRRVPDARRRLRQLRRRPPRRLLRPGHRAPRPMRRIVAILAAAILVGIAAVAVGSCGGDKPYEVRAIFDDASFVVKGEDVKIAGVKVGKIKSLKVTPERKAAVVLSITDPGFQDFRKDAKCMIRPQSLIGEQYVECSPTQGRAATTARAPKLERIEDGPGKGQYLLPAERNSVSVALDLVGNINRLPVRQRLTLILNELGVGLAGRGEDLNAVVMRSAPALQELDKVLNLLASQNQQLKQLAVDGDTIMQPLAAKRRNVTGFIKQSQKVAAATAERRAALEAGLERFPTFLRETTPTMQRLSALADELTPIATNLRAQAPAINEVIQRTGPFSQAATPALLTLGDAAKPGIPAIRAAIPITKDLRAFATQLRPVASTLAKVLTSVRRNEGLERLLDYFYFQAQAVNGFDSVSHFLRAGLIVNTCSSYAVTPTVECAAKFSGRSGASSAARSGQPRDMALARTAAVLRGEDPADVLADPAYADEDAAPTTSRSSRPSSGGGSRSGSGTGSGTGSGSGGAKGGSGTSGSRPAATPTAAPTSGSTPAATTTATPGSAATPEATEGPLLDFLFGKDAE